MQFVIILVAFILIILFRIKMPSIKGRLGENKVSNILKRLSDEYFVINDLLLKTSRETTQIDHVVISKYGIFVIETKNYKGWICGCESSENWTKNVYGNKYSFRNPLKQNYAHIKALMEILGISSSTVFIPIVAFSNQADIKVKTSKIVINFYEVLRTISCYQQERLDEIEVQQYVHKLANFTKYSKEEKKEHISNIQNEISKKNESLNNEICPNCGNMLVLRQGKYGNFLGCSNYPNCRFTKSLS